MRLGIIIFIIFLALVILLSLLIFGLLVHVTITEYMQDRKTEDEFREFMMLKKETIAKSQENVNRSKSKGQQEC